MQPIEGFLSKYKLFGSDASQISAPQYDKFITTNLERMKHLEAGDALTSGKEC